MSEINRSYEEYDPAEIAWRGTLVDIIRALPDNREWTTEKRTRWLRAMEANVDRLVRVTPDRGN